MLLSTVSNADNINIFMILDSRESNAAKFEDCRISILFYMDIYMMTQVIIKC